MAKHHVSQRFVFKISSSRLRRAKWNLNLTYSQARDNDEMIALAESQIMRFIDDINQVEDVENEISQIKSKIKSLKNLKDISYSKPKIKALYAKLDEYQFKKDYVCIVIENKKDYDHMKNHGFKINGIKFKRLLGTTGGIKMNTIVFVNEDLYPEIKRRIDNGRNMNKELVPAKLEAYQALVCSSSTPVSYPKGTIVVHDVVTHFTDNIIQLNDECEGEPIMTYIENAEITLDDSDGYGLASPELMLRWANELGENYILPGCVVRNSFCKGALFPVDFRKFAKDNGFTEICDVWGKYHNIDDIELILTDSMLKLWDSYESMDDYLENCYKNKYTFAITKTSEEKLEKVRNMNYQFLQSYDFNDEEIDELISPTVKEIKEIVDGDYNKMVLYTRGTTLNDDNVKYLDGTWMSALLVNQEMFKDPYVKSQVKHMIKKRINDAKVGVLRVDGCYALVSGDPYSLCQSMFGMEVTGLLKEGQVYSKYWIDRNIDRIVCFRAPMTSHNNIRVLDVVHNEIMDDFYQYMTTPIIFNSWDTCCDALNGMDKDGDAVISTSCDLLVRKTVPMPAVFCVQRKAPKCIPTEEDIYNSNIMSFGNAVGEITNKVTSMFEVQARYEKGTPEYEALDYRIKCGQLYQQNSIDKAKGIVAKDMPNYWHSWIASKINEDDSEEVIEEKKFRRRIVVDKKPYFMQYIYPTERKKYTTYVQNNNSKCYMKFRMSLEELLNKENPTLEEQTFIKYYKNGLPLGDAPCTINKICHRIEDLFDNEEKTVGDDFDYTIMKSGNKEYNKTTYYKVKAIYEEFKDKTKRFVQIQHTERFKSDEAYIRKYLLKIDFIRRCSEVCGNSETLCDIALDLCYKDAKISKQFVWDICGDQIVKNLLKKQNYIIQYPKKDEDGDIIFNGERFKLYTKDVSEEYMDCEDKINDCIE